MFQRFLSVPVNRLLVLSMVFIAVLPISLVAYNLNKTAWDNSWREIHEKHQLLAENLVFPISLYVKDHFSTLNLLSYSVQLTATEPKKIQDYFNNTFDTLDGFSSLAYVDISGNALAIVIAADIDIDRSKDFSRIYSSDHCYLFVKQAEKRYISGIKPSPFTMKPSILMGVPVFSADNKLLGVLLAELRVSVIENMREGIKFGIKGHSAIVDQNGRVIAHPNAEWMQEMKSLKQWPIIQSMMAGKSGVAEFYSSFMKEDMVAGFASVPGTGWGVMVPQPKSEVAEQVKQFMFSNYIWGGVGLIVAIILSFLISNWITRPINRLAKESQKLLDNNLSGDLEYPADYEPQEAKQLGYALKSLVRGLQHSRDEVQELNNNLHENINQATKELRIANEKLEETAQSDFLTSLANRRYFEMDLGDIISRKNSEFEHISLLLFDIDNFKDINDTYGHAAGDEALTNVASTLESFMRQGDIVARYAGDEFVIRFNCDGRVAISRANQIRQMIESLNIKWRNSVLNITVSIGIYSAAITEDLEVKDILHKVDIAMYEAKKRGRNCVKTYKTEMAMVESIS